MDKATLNQQISQAESLYKDAKKNRKILDEMKENERMAQYTTSEWSDFIKQHNIVSRYIIVHGQFRTRAFRMYLQRLAKIGYKDRDGWAERQADYVKYLWREMHPHGNNAEAMLQWKHVRDGVRQEMREFEDSFERAKTRSEADRKLAFENYRQKLAELLIKQSSQQSN